MDHASFPLVVRKIKNNFLVYKYLIFFFKQKFVILEKIQNASLMNWKIFFGSSLWILVLLMACRKDSLSFDAPSQILQLSADTVVLDTVYNQLRSSTYAVKIFNKENKNIQIPKIYLEKGISSQYKINVDGKAGYSFNNIPLRANDSLYIFIEVAPNIQSKELIAEDQIKISTVFSEQQITLLSVIQDAEFIVSTSENPKIINENSSWDNSKIKIISGEVQLAENKTLSIEKGTKVYLMANGSLKINKNATLNINGNLGEEIIIRGHRNEPKYDTLPKNWDKIYLGEGSTLNMNYAKIFGGTTGLYLNHSKAKIKNSIIHTFQDYGIFAINANLEAQNMVMNNSRIANLNIVKGGTYNILHSTLANYWQLSYSSALAIYAQNNWQNQNADLNLNFKNSIAYTQKSNAIKFAPTTDSNFNYIFENSLIRFGENAGFSWNNNPFIIHSLANIDPLFTNPHTRNMSLSLSAKSPAKGKGNHNISSQIPLDIKKINRITSPTIGAYQ